MTEPGSVKDRPFSYEYYGFDQPPAAASLSPSPPAEPATQQFIEQCLLEQRKAAIRRKYGK